MQRLDRCNPWDMSSVQVRVLSSKSWFLGCEQQFPGRAMNRFLPVAVMSSCGDLVSVQGLENQTGTGRGPLMHCAHCLVL
jgi:hypothetical protein